MIPALPNNEPKRLRGRAGVEQRKRRLAAEPLCRHCAQDGRVTRATEVDHITPLAYGGTDDDSNVQSLCDDCHAIKTAFDGAGHGGAANHPEWLKPSAVPLTIVCGPPCAGKSTWVQERAASWDLTIDVDVIAKTLDPTYAAWTSALQGDLLDRAVRVRNAMLGSLSRRRAGAAWFIVAAPTADERRWWASKLGGETVLLHPGPDECKRRAIARGTPAAALGVDRWERRAQEPWRPRLTSACDASGRPTDSRHPWNRRPRGG